MTALGTLPKYDWTRPYTWNYEHAPEPVDVAVTDVPGTWDFCGLPVDSPLGVPAGPLLNGKWCLYYASLGFDVLTYKTVRSRERACYPLPNLQPVLCGQMRGGEAEVAASVDMDGSWAVSFGMPSKDPDIWRADVEETRKQLPKGKLLVVSVVASVQEGWSLDDLAEDYALCAKWAVESGADAVETNFSCPNVTTCDGQLYQIADDSRVVAEYVREAVGSTPYIIKIGHFTCDLAAAELLDAVGDAVDALAMTNSVATHVRDHDGQLLFDGQVRGICGEGILETSLQQTRSFAELIRHKQTATKIIGVGGIGSASDVRAYLDAGAHACHLATSAMLNPALAIEIRRELAGK